MNNTKTPGRQWVGADGEIHMRLICAVALMAVLVAPSARSEPEIFKGADLKLGQQLIEQLEAGEMPPQRKPQPTAGERARLIAWARGQFLARLGVPQSQQLVTAGR